MKPIGVFDKELNDKRFLQKVKSQDNGNLWKRKEKQGAQAEDRDKKRRWMDFQLLGHPPYYSKVGDLTVKGQWPNR